MSARPQEWFRCVELRRRQASAPYAANLNLNAKVLDFIQFGGPDLTVGSTIFEMWMGL